MKTRMYFLSVLSVCIISLFILGDVVQAAAEPLSGIIKGNNVNLRSAPGLKSQIITILQQGSPVDVLEQEGSWFKVQLQDGLSGWIYHQYFRVKPLTVISRDRFTASYTDELLAYAKSFLEVPYVYGGDTSWGFDCSGFTMHVFAKFGINLPHKADWQSEIGTEVPSMEDLIPGDLVFFKTLGSTVINHVGIYLGDHRFINASSGYGAVRISPLDSGYYFDCYAGGRRLRDDRTDVSNISDEPNEHDEQAVHI